MNRLSWKEDDSTTPLDTLDVVYQIARDLRSRHEARLQAFDAEDLRLRQQLAAAFMGDSELFTQIHKSN